MKNFKKGLSFLLIFVLALSMTLMTGCAKKEKSEFDKVVVTVNDSKVTLGDMMYYIYAVESQGNYYEQMYQAYFGTSYWDTEYEEGKTIRQMLKEYVMDQVVMNEILYDKAVAAKVTLTDEEKADNEASVTEMFDSLTESIIKQTGFTKEKLQVMQEKTAIVYKYQDSLVEALDIDDEAIKAGVDVDKYRQYNTEYMFFATTTTNEAGESASISDEDKAAKLKQANEVLEKAKEGKTFEELIVDYEGATNDVSNFVSGDEALGAEYEKAALKLDNNAFSKVVETEDGFYVIKMVDNDSKESYDAAVEEAIGQEEAAKFTESYEAMKKDYKITENEEIWSTIVMGETIKVEEPEASTDETITNDTTTDDTTTDETTTDDATTDDNAVEEDSTVPK